MQDKPIQCNLIYDKINTLMTREEKTTHYNTIPEKPRQYKLTQDTHTTHADNT